LSKFAIREITHEEAIPVREVLLAGNPASPMERPSDLHESALHFGAFIGEELVGVLSASQSRRRLDDPPNTYRMYSYAVVDGLRGRGVGTTLAGHMMLELYNRGADLVWATPHPSTISIYERFGVVTDEYFAYEGEDSVRLQVVAAEREQLRHVLRRFLPKAGRSRLTSTSWDADHLEPTSN
jgi:GNAT superfamily N-acetyltransferase